MEPRSSELEALCLACGLCCDGSLFGRVGLEPGEVAGARARGLVVLSDGRAFDQPCRALDESERGRACAAYGERPASCRRFVCRLHETHRREGGPLAPRLAVVAEARRRLASVGSGEASEAEVRALGDLLAEAFARA